jgi:DNA-binding IclR family transcriptional regulator
VKSIARPIVLDGRIHGAISLTGPRSRFFPDKMSEYDEMVQEQIEIIKIHSEYY